MKRVVDCSIQSRVQSVVLSENFSFRGGLRRRQHGVPTARAAQERHAVRLLLRLLAERRQPRAREQRLRGETVRIRQIRVSILKGKKCILKNGLIFGLRSPKMSHVIQGDSRFV